MLYDDWRLGSISGDGGAFGRSFANRGAGTDDLLHLVVSTSSFVGAPACIQTGPAGKLREGGFGPPVFD